MYADDNDGAICGGWARPRPVNGVPPWVMPPLDYAGATIVQMASGNVTLEQRYNGLAARRPVPLPQRGQGLPLPGRQPQEPRHAASAPAPAYRIYRSYSLPDYLRGTEHRDPKKLFTFKEPANKMLFVEEIYDGAAGNYNHDGWSYAPYTGAMWDPLGIFHSDACTFSFMDGHAERKKWDDKRTIIYCTSRAEAAAQGLRQELSRSIRRTWTWTGSTSTIRARPRSRRIGGS